MPRKTVGFVSVLLMSLLLLTPLATAQTRLYLTAATEPYSPGLYSGRLFTHVAVDVNYLTCGSNVKISMQWTVTITRPFEIKANEHYSVALLVGPDGDHPIAAARASLSLEHDGRETQFAHFSALPSKEMKLQVAEIVAERNVTVQALDTIKLNLNQDGDYYCLTISPQTPSYLEVPWPFETEAAKAQPGPAAVTYSMGAAQMDKACEKVQFTPVPDPVQYPSGTTEVAYHVEVDPELQIQAELSVDNPCGSARTLESSRCNKFVIIGGRPVISQWTTVLRCQDGKPLNPGSYSLRGPGKTIPFEIK